MNSIDQQIAHAEQDDAEVNAAVADQNNDKWGVSPEANKLTIQHYFSDRVESAFAQSPVGKAFGDFCNGKISEAEYFAVEDYERTLEAPQSLAS